VGNGLNLKINFLKVLGIIYVVVGHVGGIVLIGDAFPFYTFHMPLFFFISGYLFKDEPFMARLKKRFKKLVIPYFVWNLIYGLIATWLKVHKGFDFSLGFNPYNLLVEPWITSVQFAFMVPAWFMLALFLVSVFYPIIRKVCKREILILMVSFGLSVMAQYLARNGFNHGFSLTINRMIYSAFFYALGHYYKLYLERYTIKFWHVLCGIGINVLLMTIYPNIGNAISTMQFKGFLLMPYLVACIGILANLYIVNALNDNILNSRLVINLGSNTDAIMLHHYFWHFCATTICYKLFTLPGFDMTKYLETINYQYLYQGVWQFAIPFLIFSLAMPVICRLCYKSIKQRAALFNPVLKRFKI
jgi:fucose 4-O-acetylase-like acetyltransferase